MEFTPFPKIPRLSRDIVVTEKIDGTNAQVLIRLVSELDYETSIPAIAHDTAAGLVMFAGSRSRWITPGKSTDNAGFAAWVLANQEELWALGPGQHFGEWWGKGIQRGYGQATKRFSLFNTHRWAQERPACCDVVPVLYQGPFDTKAVDYWVSQLQLEGSFAAPGFMDPEGVIVYHPASNLLFKKTCKDDEQPKSALKTA